MLRYARYAAATFFALLAAGFVALWVRSYYNHDVVMWRISDTRALSVTSVRGKIIWHPFEATGLTKTLAWEASPLMPGDWSRFDAAVETGHWIYIGGAEPEAFVVPHWVLAALSLALTALFTFNRTWRYSLRTILVATTLLAAVLGLAVYAV
jgi:hypothetical protein